MSDDRISETPTSPPCPVCASGFTENPGANCPACGRTLAPPAPIEYDFRLRAERRRFDGPISMAFGLILLSGGLLLSIGAPGLLIPLVILLAPALVRTARLRSTDARAPWIESFLSALGVSFLTGLASGIACSAVCVAIIATDKSGGLGILGTAFAWGGITALVVFVWLTIVLWPRADRPGHDTGED